ncbi:MAG: HEAT repeat domain-containing protein [Armatimonadetes bacterium]|nr:HEAT repeat domain-containing protein [Armatimonadota bacterium]
MATARGRERREGPLIPQEERSRLDRLRRELRSRTRGVGYRAADELAQAGSAGRSILIRALDSRDRNVRIHAAWAVRLLNYPDAVARLIELLREERETYLPLQQALPKKPAPQLVEKLIEAARDPGNRNRKFHTMLLGDVEDPSVLDTLLTALQSDDQELQEGSFLAMKHAGAELRQVAGPALVQALSVRLPLPRRRAPAWIPRQRAVQTVPLALISTVGLVAGDKGVGVLCEILRSDTHPSYRLAAMSALITVGELAVGRCWWALASLVREPVDGPLQATAAEALRRLQVREAESELLDLLHHGRGFQRRNAAHALEGCGGELSAAPVRERLLSDSDVHVRRTCARTLARLRGAGAEEALLQALRDRDSWVAWNAAWALQRLGLPEVIPELLRGLEDRDRRIRCHCAEALGQLGISTPEAVEALVVALGENTVHLARTAAWALRQLNLVEALEYARTLAASPDSSQRKIGQRALRWLRPDRASYWTHLPVRSSRLEGVVAAPDDRSEGGPRRS